ncbi:hypothetical protein [Natranaerobius trueperi]|nr:hypothetical protein [Natranaerobius trueperi]
MRRLVLMSRAEKIFMFIMICLFIGVIIWFFAWINTGGADISDSREIWPLEEGASWRYQVEGEGAEDEVIVTVTKALDQSTYHLQFDYGSHETLEQYTYQDDGLIWDAIENPLGEYQRVPAQYLIKFPIDRTHEWEWQGELLPISGEELGYSGKGEFTQSGLTTIDLPIGRYEGIEITSTMNINIQGEKNEIEETRVYVPEIGLVKQEVVENGQLKLKKLLTDYQME